MGYRLRNLIVFTALCITFTSSVQAGAWPREKGGVFVSTGLSKLDTDTGSLDEQTLYLEYGLTEKVTVGFSGSYTENSNGQGHLFLRLPIPNGTNKAVMAVEIGAGTKSVDAITFDPFVQLGLSWGKGIELWGKNGWLALDGAWLSPIDNGETRFKLDATLGLALGNRVKVMGQGFVDITDNGESLTLMPSVIYTVSPNRLDFVVGYEAKLGTDARNGIRLGLWTQF